VLPDYVPQTSTSFRENWQFCYVGASPGQAWKDLTEEQRARVMQFLPRDMCVPDESTDSSGRDCIAAGGS